MKQVPSTEPGMERKINGDSLHVSVVLGKEKMIAEKIIYFFVLMDVVEKLREIPAPKPLQESSLKNYQEYSFRIA